MMIELEDQKRWRRVKGDRKEEGGEGEEEEEEERE